MAANLLSAPLHNQTLDSSTDKAVDNQTSSLIGDYRSPLTMISAQITLIILLATLSIFGNSMVVFLIKRFKTLRTISNITLANMALVDVLNIMTNLPGFALVGVCELDQVVRGKAVSLFMGASQAFFNNMKVFCMLIMLIDRYFAISMGMRYKVWMTVQKMILFMVLAWILGISMNIPWLLALSKIDLGDAPTKEYRIVFFQKVGKNASFYVFSICGVLVTVICLLTRRSLMKSLETFKQREQDGQDPQGTQLSKELARRDARAATTIVLTIIAYIACYTPAILYAVFVPGRSEIAKTSVAKWFGFFANFFLFVSSATNPFIYLCRSSRLRSATKEFFQSPCGSGDLFSEILPPQPQASRISRATSNRGNQISASFISESVNVKTDAIGSFVDEAQQGKSDIFGELNTSVEESILSKDNNLLSATNYGYEGDEVSGCSTSSQACAVSVRICDVLDKSETPPKQREEAAIDCLKFATGNHLDCDEVYNNLDDVISVYKKDGLCVGAESCETTLA